MPPRRAILLLCALLLTPSEKAPSQVTNHFVGSAGLPAPATRKSTTAGRRPAWPTSSTTPKPIPKPSSATSPTPIPLVTFQLADVAFVYGSRWKQRYFTKRGDDYYAEPAQWDVASKRWLPYHAETGTDWWIPFYGPTNFDRPTGPLCDGCHSVNYNVANQAGHRVERRLRKVPRPRQPPRRPSHAHQHRQPRDASTTSAATTPASSATARASPSSNPIAGQALRLARRLSCPA